MASGEDLMVQPEVPGLMKSATTKQSKWTRGAGLDRPFMSRVKKKR